MFRQHQCYLHQVCHIIATKISRNSSFFKPFHPTWGGSPPGFLSISSASLCIWYTGQSLPLSSHLCRPSPAIPDRLFLEFCCGIHLKCPKDLHADADIWLMKSASSVLHRFFFIWSTMFSSLNKVLHLRWYLTNGFGGLFGGTCWQRFICYLTEVAMVVLQKAIQEHWPDALVV